MPSNPKITKELLDFIARSPTPFHATHNALALCLDAGFKLLDESNTWQCQPNRSYVVTRNDSSIIAFKTGKDLSAGMSMVGAHTDSPCLKIKPNADLQHNNYWQLGVEVYGGALLHPWLDRDLSIAGRVSGLDQQGKLFHELIDFKDPVAIIPNLAIHLDRDANKNKTINPQQHLPLILAQSDDKAKFKDLVGSQCSTKTSQVLDYELYCYDTQAPSFVGLNQEFISSARLDNLVSVYLGLRALLDYSGENACLFVANDHEEVGSASACGAQGPFLRSVLERLSDNAAELSRLIHNSSFLSCDNAHGIHPNYADKHDKNHGPILNQGPVIKTNANQRYASNSVTSAQFQQYCQQGDIPLQHFVVRSDMGCGSTIGPITAAELGIQTLDIGIAQWAMHSIRETAGTQDCEYLYQAIGLFIAGQS